jgi:hypothetical protein
MTVASLDAEPGALRRESLLIDGLRIMRERLAVYVVFAGASAVAAWLALPHMDMYAILAHNPTALVTSSPVSVVLILALVALFFIVPSALRRIDPAFRMTFWRVALTVATIVAVGATTEIGYALAVIPGIVVGVLCSQALVGALLRLREGATLRDLGPALAGAVRSSIAMTRPRFATTLVVIAASLAILLVPFSIALFVLAILGVTMPPSLLVTAPLLFLVFAYFECVRYALLVRWYRRLASEDPSRPSP